MRERGREAGFSLLEMVIGLAFLAIIGLVASSISKYLFGESKGALTLGAQNELMSFTRALGVRATSAIDFTLFSQGETFARAAITTSLPTLIQNGGGAGTFTVKVSGADYQLRRNSSTLDVFSVEDRRDDTVNGFVASRCIDAKDIRRPFDKNAFMSLSRFPVLKNDVNGKPEVLCCAMRPAGLDCSGGEITGNSPWRVRIFYGQQDFLRIYPVEADLRHVSGVGFFSTFDHGTQPVLFNHVMFLIDNQCQRSKDANLGIKDCSNETRITSKVLEKEVIRRIHQSGIIDLGR